MCPLGLVVNSIQEAAIYPYKPSARACLDFEAEEILKGQPGRRLVQTTFHRGEGEQDAHHLLDDLVTSSEAGRGPVHATEKKNKKKQVLPRGPVFMNAPVAIPFRLTVG